MKVLQEVQPHLSVFFKLEEPEEVSVPAYGGMLAYHAYLTEYGDDLRVEIHRNGAYDKRIDTRYLRVEGLSFDQVVVRFQTFCHADAVGRTTPPK